MFGLGPNHFKILSFFTLGLLCSVAFGEGGYPGRDNGFPDQKTDYVNEIAQNKQRIPRKPGESNSDYRIRTTHLYPEFTAPPVAQDDVTSDPNERSVDRAEKLKDASRFALEGETASRAQFADLLVAGITTGINISFDPGEMAKNSAESQKYFAESDKYKVNVEAFQASVKTSRTS